MPVKSLLASWSCDRPSD